MTLSPRNMILPAVLTSSICLAILSTTINTGFAQPAAPPNKTAVSKTNIESIQLNTGFPENIQKWKKMIETTAAESGLDPNLIAAVMLQESGGDPQAFSTSGAVGLMQIMPKDGIAAKFICEDHPCFINRPTINELLNPLFNIQYGSKYLTGLIRQKGSEREALFAYGPMDMGYDYADLVLAIYENYR